MAIGIVYKLVYGRLGERILFVLDCLTFRTPRPPSPWPPCYQTPPTLSLSDESVRNLQEAYRQEQLNNLLFFLFYYTHLLRMDIYIFSSGDHLPLTWTLFCNGVFEQHPRPLEVFTSWSLLVRKWWYNSHAPFFHRLICIMIAICLVFDSQRKRAPIPFPLSSQIGLSYITQEKRKNTK